VFCYFDGFADDAGTVYVDTEYDVCSIGFDDVFCLCGVLVLHSDASDVFRNFGGYVAVHLNDMHVAHFRFPG
jgi:hypothetical protein